MSDNHKKQLLVVMDGSQQALNAVRYVGEVADADRTIVVLFEIGTGLPDVLQGIEAFAGNGAMQGSLRSGESHTGVSTVDHLTKARDLLLSAGFGPDHIVTERQTSATGAVKAIIQESYNGYSAIVVGRTGISRLKYLIFGSIAQKLVERVRHMPIVVVSGRPPSRRFLVAIEQDDHALHRIQSVADFAVIADTEVVLCHCGIGSRTGSPSTDPNRIHVPGAEDESLMRSAIGLLEQAGMDRRAIRRDTIAPQGDLLQEILESGQAKGCGSIVAGHQTVVNFAHAHFRGQFSGSAVGALDHLAIWVVN